MSTEKHAQRPGRDEGEVPVLRRLKRLRRRLYLRRWLVATVVVTTLSFVVASDLTVLQGVIGVLVFSAAAALLPREGVLKRTLSRDNERARPAGMLEPMERLIAGLPEPALILSRQGVVLRFNAQAADAYGALKTGAPVSAAVRHPQLLHAIDNAASNQRHQVVSINEVVPVERWYSAAVSWIGQPGAGPGDPAIFVFLRDLTEQERIGQMRADFVANASHELRTPLASVLGFIETLRGPARDDEKAREEFLAVMAREAERMKRVIDDLLSLSRVEMKAHLRPTDPVEIGEILNDVRATLEHAAQERNIDFEIRPFDAPVYVPGEREGLIQVFQNLTNNAIKYGRDGGFVRIEIAREAGGEPAIAVSVIDNGLGIPEEHVPRLTERFYRVNVAASRERGGTGLGLSIVKHILNRHRGQLRITSTPGEGSRFTVTLPEHTPGAAGRAKTGARDPAPADAAASVAKNKQNQSARLS